MEITYSKKQHAFVVKRKSKLCQGRKTIIACGNTRAEAVIKGISRLLMR